MRSLYFSDEETKNLDLDFVEILDMARRLSGVTFYIARNDFNSRSEVDLLVDDDHARFHIVRSLMSAGIDRIDIGHDRVHVGYKIEPKNRMRLIP